MSVTINGNGDGTAVSSVGTVTLDSIEHIMTATGHDNVTTQWGTNIVYTFGGDDTVSLGGGDDFAILGSGDDFADGGANQDYLVGEAGEDTLKGGYGDDTLFGGDDDDVLIGGKGVDSLHGGDGEDVFRWENGDFGKDALKDFVIGEDILDLSDFVADALDPYGSYVGKIAAVAADGGASSTPMAKTDAGWKTFATLEGVASANAASALADGSLFWSDIEYDVPGGGFLPVPEDAFGGRHQSADDFFFG